MKRILRPFNVALFFASLLMMQCTDDSKKRFEDPPWLGGTNIETLEKGEKYTQFLALMDKAEYRTSIENQLFTLFVPSDSAFDAYLQKNGMSSVEELSREQAEELFAQHILINPRSREQLLYEYAWEVLETPEGEYGTLFHKKQTYSLPIDYFEEVKYNKTFQGQTLQIYRGRTLIPLFTTEYFNDYFGDPSGSDYLFMYPNSSWSGTQWHDAMVLNFEGTASGFIYYLDKVVEPIPTIETYLKNNQDKYGVFYDIAQQFADYVNASINEKNERRYQKTYVGISDFACEEGPARGDPQNMLYSFSAYIPTDNVLQEYLNNTVLKTYPDMLSVPELFKVYLLQSHIKTRLDLPSKIQKRFLNYYGDNVEIDINNDIHEVIMCSNGPVYVINRILEPNAFTCAPGPLFFNKSYSTFLYALEYSGVLTNLIKSDIDVTILAPSNDELNEMGIRQNEL
ncbi:MAG: fasciclin domain-containing protein, partial [Bacteroidales bacterium]|nr:fasciclin domain-containing protein [Bacteroidales bacterium]